MTTSYPGAIDSLEDNIDNDTLTINDHATQHNDLADAVVAIETELGTDPKGSYADVKTRLNASVITAPASNQVISPTGDNTAASFRSSSSQNVSPLTDWQNHSGTTEAYIDKNFVLSAQGLAIGGTALASTHLSDSAGLARLASPTFTGTVSAPTPTTGDNSTKVATTAFVIGALGAAVTSGALSTLPAATSGLNGTWFYAIDQVALYLCVSATWVRVTDQVGQTSINLTGTASPGHILLQGQSWPSNTSGVYTAIKTWFGNPSTVPDFRTFAPVGWKSGDASFGTLLSTTGEKTHTLVAGEAPVLTGSVTAAIMQTLDSSASDGTAVTDGSGSGGSHAPSGMSVTVNSGGGGAHNNIQPSFVVNFEAKL